MKSDPAERDEYLTIIAPSASEVMAEFKARGLDQEGYVIAGRIGRHRFSLIGGPAGTELFSGDGLIAATFSRKVAS